MEHRHERRSDLGGKHQRRRQYPDVGDADHQRSSFLPSDHRSPSASVPFRRGRVRPRMRHLHAVFHVEPRCVFPRFHHLLRLAQPIHLLDLCLPIHMEPSLHRRRPVPSRLLSDQIPDAVAETPQDCHRLLVAALHS